MSTKSVSLERYKHIYIYIYIYVHVHGSSLVYIYMYSKHRNYKMHDEMLNEKACGTEVKGMRNKKLIWSDLVLVLTYLLKP